MEKNSLITSLTEAIDQSKGDLGRNQYLLKRIKENKEIFNSDKQYLERILDLKIPGKIEAQVQKKDEPVFRNPNLIKCATCDKEIKLEEKSSRHRNVWHHETCYKVIPQNKYEQKEIKFEKDQGNIILENIQLETTHEEKPIIEEPISEHRQTKKVKQDPVLFLLAGTILAFLFTAAYLLIGSFSVVAMFLGGVLVMYQLIDSKKWSKPKYRNIKRAPAIFPMFMLFLPFGLAGVLAIEGYTAWESAYRAVILWGLTLVFWSTLLMIPLSVYSKNKEFQVPTSPHTPMVTILIPAYNEEKVIANTIESTLEINYPNKDIIVIDDGSKDNTLQIAKRYQDKGVKVLTKPNGGKATAPVSQIRIFE
ncbi:MAG TPA: glycosyltransferase [Nitrosopumilus sp.]|nr:glycosyltransferase [Thermoproteota archaeon]HJJ22721.1 glycosyltransferase [Nitrosopumilus sp.]